MKYLLYFLYFCNFRYKCMLLLDYLGYNIYIVPEYYTTGINWNYQIFWYNPTKEWQKYKNGDIKGFFLTSGTMLYGDNNEYPTRNICMDNAISHGIALYLEKGIRFKP